MQSGTLKLILLSLGVELCLACEGTVQDRGEVLIRDSAGIEIVESTEPQWRSGQQWLVHDSAAVDIGQEGSDPGKTFDRIVGVAVFEDGGIAVANAGDNSVRFFTSTGELLNIVGGTGDGPGEIRGLSSLQRHDGNVYAGGRLRITVYNGQADLVETIGVPNYGRLIELYPDGAMLIQQSGRRRALTDGRFAEMAAYIVVDPDGEVIDTIAELPELEWVTMREAESLVMFGGMGHVTAGDSLMYHGWNKTIDVGVMTRRGTVVRRIRWQGTRSAVTPQDRTELIDAMLESREGEQSAAMRIALEEIPVAETHPAHGAILVDAEGFLWVQRYALDGYIRTLQASRAMPPVGKVPWDVFDRAGRWLGPVQMPAGLQPFEIGSDFVAGVYYDDYDVEHVRVHRLTRQPGVVQDEDGR